MPKKGRFQPVKLESNVQLSERQQAALLSLVDDQGNVLDLAMTVEFGVELVKATRAAFMALEARKLIEAGTTAEQRRSFKAKSATVAMPLTAEANANGTELSPVLVTVAPASTYEQVFGLTVEWAERLAEELQTAANQMRQTGR